MLCSSRRCCGSLWQALAVKLSWVQALAELHPCPLGMTLNEINHESNLVGFIAKMISTKMTTDSRPHSRQCLQRNVSSRHSIHGIRSIKCFKVFMYGSSTNSSSAHQHMLLLELSQNQLFLLDVHPVKRQPQSDGSCGGAMPSWRLRGPSSRRRTQEHWVQICGRYSSFFGCFLLKITRRTTFYHTFHFAAHL